MKMPSEILPESVFTYPCTGDVCAGDTIVFEEAVFEGSFRKPRFAGDRKIAAHVLKDSYGADKQQHTFSLEIIWCRGHDPIAPGKRIRRKGRNVYRNGTKRMPWANEAERGVSLDEKHQRGDKARVARDIRKGVA